MRKELNYNFFDMNAGDPSPNWNFIPKPANTEQIKILDEVPIISDNHAEISELRAEIIEIQKTSKLKSERFNQSLQRLENQQSLLTADISEKFALLLQKLTEQKKYDQKVQDIVDRHNNLLKGYEIRLNQMQKLLVQKEQDYIEAVMTLKELKSEISRLKRL